MNLILEQRFFAYCRNIHNVKFLHRSLQAIEELATHVSILINEQDYSILLRYFPLVYTVLNRIVCTV